jgi:hypothetical protein
MTLFVIPPSILDRRPTLSISLDPDRRPTLSISLNPDRRPTLSISLNPDRRPTLSISLDPDRRPTLSISLDPDRRPTLSIFPVSLLSLGPDMELSHAAAGLTAVAEGTGRGLALPVAWQLNALATGATETVAGADTADGRGRRRLALLTLRVLVTRPTIRSDRRGAAKLIEVPYLDLWK